jgi:ATP-binding cassette subfamily B protein
MTLPWKGGKTALVVAAAEDRRFRFLLCCAATLAAVIFSFITPQIIRFTIDSVLGTEPLKVPAFVSTFVDQIGGVGYIKKNIWICAAFILAAALLSAFCNMFRRYNCGIIGETVAWRLHNILYSHIQKLPYSWHISCQTGDIIQRCTTDVDNIRNFIHNQLSELMRVFCVFVISLIIMFSMDIFMSLVSLILIPVIVAFSILYFRKVSVEFNRADIAEGQVHAAAQENYTGVRVVRAFGRESYEMERFSEKTKKYQDIWVYIGKMLGLFWGAGDFFSGLQLVIIIGFGVWRSVQGQLSPGTFLAFYTYCNWMIWPVRQLGRMLADLSKTLVAAGRISEILASEPETDPPDALTPDLKGEICFNNVTFNYGDKDPILKNISFTLKPGESMAILGATGSGKSTLVHLLSRLYDLNDNSSHNAGSMKDSALRYPHSLSHVRASTDAASLRSSITINGVDIRRVARPWLRKHIGLCLQEAFLFSKTIKENIAMAKPEMDIEEIKKAAAVAMIDETIESFTDGYNTVIGERGVTLSGGQKQRLAIARMLMGNTPVIIFDDSLSAVDIETDAKIRAALRNRVKDAAVIIISHRISSLMQADKILVLKNQMVEDIGSHEELLQRGGSYKRIFDLQADSNNK